MSAWTGAVEVVGAVLAILALPGGRSPLTRFAWRRGHVGKLERAAYLVAGIVLLLGVWELASAAAPTGPTRIPEPSATFLAMASMFRDGIYYDLALSTMRVVLGFSIACIISIPTAIYFGALTGSSLSVVPVLSFIRYIPPTAFTALLVIYFGVGEKYQIAVIFFGVVFFNLRMTIDIVEDTDFSYIDLASVVGGGSAPLAVKRLLSIVVVPSSGPRIWDMLRINLSFAWTFLVVAEVVGADRGLGRVLVNSQRFLRIEDLYAAILLFGVLGLMTDAIMAGLKKVLFRWHSGTVGR